MFGGDVALDRWQPTTDSNHPFTGLAAAMRSADVRIVNLETQFTSRITPTGIIGTSLRAEPAALDALSALELSGRVRQERGGLYRLVTPALFG